MHQMTTSTVIVPTPSTGGGSARFRRCPTALAGVIVALMAATGCSFDANELKAFPVLDSSASGGSSRDSNRTNDSLTTAAGGVDGAAVVGTGGAFDTGGMGGRGIDAAGTGSGGTGDSSIDGPNDVSLADAGQPCTNGGVTYQPGQSFTSNCVTYTCVSGSIFTSRGTPCADAADVPGAGGMGGVSSGGMGGATPSTGGIAGTGGMARGTGGMAAGGSIGGTGGTIGTGGIIATGGAVGSGGVLGTGGLGTGGSTSPDAASVCTGYTGAGGGSGLTQGLVAYYPCESASGTTLPDQSGNGRDATLVTGSGGSLGYSFGAGKVGNALYLAKASKGYATLPAGILAGTCEMTVATWVNLNTNNTTASAWQRIWDFGTSSTSGYMYVAASTNLAAASNALRFTISASGNAAGAEQTVDGLAPLPTLAWHHVAVVLGSTGAVLYLDGVQVGASSAVTLRPADLGNTPNNYIGRSQYSADPYLDGHIDEFRVYNRALSAAEIQALM